MSKRLRRPLFLTLTFLLAVAAAYLYSKPQKLQPYPGMGGDFTLQSSHGPVSLQDFRGKLVAIYFGYTSCPDICPTSLNALGQALNQLDEDDASQIQGLFISVDPERDQAEKIAEYAAYFHPAFLGVTGELQQLDEIARRYGAFFHKAEIEGSALGYAVDHSSMIFLVDQHGVLQQMIQHSNSSQAILSSIRSLLRSG